MRLNRLLYRFAIGVLGVFLLVGFVGPLFSSSAPWSFVDKKGQKRFPAWRMYVDQLGIKDVDPIWKTKDWTQEKGRIDNLIPYDATYIDLAAVGAKPPDFARKHYLGTDLLGRDVLAGLVEGAFVSLAVGLLVLFISVFLSLAINFLTTYIGNDLIKVTSSQLLVLFGASSYSFYLLFIAIPIEGIWSSLMRVLIFLFIGLALYSCARRFIPDKNSKSFAIPMDDIGLKVYEIFKSIPSLIILLILVGLAPEKGVVQLSLIIGLFLWVILFRYIRFAILEEKALDRHSSLENLGVPQWRIMVVHLIPSMLYVLVTPMIYIFIGAIVTEASLSFLGVGLNDDFMSWGKIFAQARQRIGAWWLVLFPALVLFLTLFSLNILSKESVSSKNVV